MYDNETPEEKAAREREQDLEDAQPSPDDDIFAALSKWLVRNSGVTKKVGLLCAIALGMKSLGIGPSFSDDTTDLSAQRHDYGVTSADGTEMNPMDAEYSVEYRRQLQDNDEHAAPSDTRRLTQASSTAQIKREQDKLVREIMKLFRAMTLEEGMHVRVTITEGNDQLAIVNVQYKIYQGQADPIEFRLEVHPTDLEQGLETALERANCIIAFQSGNQYWIDLTHSGQELEAIRRAFGSDDRIIGSLVSVEIGPDQFESQSTSVIVGYINYRDDTVERGPESAKLSFQDVTPNVVSEELGKALEHLFHVIKEERDGSKTTYWINLDLDQELETILAAFHVATPPRLKGYDLDLEIKTDDIATQSMSVIVKYFAIQEGQKSWMTFGEPLKISGITPADLMRELRVALQRENYMITSEIDRVDGGEYRINLSALQDSSFVGLG